MKSKKTFVINQISNQISYIRKIALPNIGYLLTKTKNQTWNRLHTLMIKLRKFSL